MTAHPVREKLRSCVRAVSIGTLLAVCTTSFAADEVAVFPEGWSADPAAVPYAISPSGAAVALFRHDEVTGDLLGSRVLQLVGKSVYETDFLGRVVYLQYSLDGDKLLVQENPPDAPDTVRMSMLTSSGSVLWVKDTGSWFYGWSADGDSLFARTYAGMGRYGTQIDIHDTDGFKKREVHLGAYPSGVAALGAYRVIVTQGETATCHDVSNLPSSLCWQLSGEEYDTAFASIRSIGADHLVIDQVGGRFVLLNHQGQVLYRYNTEYLAKNDPDMSIGEYGSYEIYPGSNPSRFVLFNGTGAALGLDAVSGQLTKLNLALRVAPGSVVRDRFEHGRVVILSAQQLRVRLLGDVF